MNALVIFDSRYGNTRLIAEALAQELECSAKNLKETDNAEIGKADLLVIGCPTHKGQPSANLINFISDLPEGILKNKKIAAFDTRIWIENNRSLESTIIGMIDFASPKFARTLASLGAELVAEPEGFEVKGMEGPLKDGELGRAKAWGQKLKVASGF